MIGLFLAAVLATTWQPVKIGGGGFVTGMDVDPSGATYVARTDTFGAYVSDSTGPWHQLISASSMPSAYLSAFTSGTVQTFAHGVYEIRVSPSDPSRLYMVFENQVWKSTNRGATWTQTASIAAGTMDPSGGNARRHWGEKMAIDPANPDVVYVGSVTAGLWVTFDAGATWSQVPTATIPVATGTYAAAGITGIVFDPDSGTTLGRTNVLYLCSNGNGVYRSVDAGQTWEPLSGGPTWVTHATIASGVYLAVNRYTSSLYRWTGSAWATTSIGNDPFAISVDPFAASRIAVAFPGGQISVSTNGGLSFGSRPSLAFSGAGDVEWFANANYGASPYMTAGALRFDPLVANKLWLTHGIGVSYSDPTASPTTWRARSAGIEELVATDVAVPPGSPDLVVAGMDRSLWVVPRSNASYPSHYEAMGSSASLILAWAVDYSRSNPNHLVAIINHGLTGEPELSGYSLDGGATWTTFPVQPGTGGFGGAIIAPSIDNIIAVIGTKYAFRSIDRGASWTRLTLPGDSGADTSNLHGGYSTRKHILAVDGGYNGTTNRILYLYFYTHGVYRSDDDGATWTLVSTGTFAGSNMYWQVKLRSVPGEPGHLFLMAGQAGGSTNPNPQSGCSLWRSTDYGVTWTPVPGVGEPYDLAAGKPAPGHSYPAIYFAGWYNGTWGIWRSIDATATWEQVSAWAGTIDTIYTLAASQDTYGDVYAALSGSGWVVGTEGSSTTDLAAALSPSSQVSGQVRRSRMMCGATLSW